MTEGFNLARIDALLAEAGFKSEPRVLIVPARNMAVFETEREMHALRTLGVNWRRIKRERRKALRRNLLKRGVEA